MCQFSPIQKVQSSGGRPHNMSAESRHSFLVYFNSDLKFSLTRSISEGECVRACVCACVYVCGGMSACCTVCVDVVRVAASSALASDVGYRTAGECASDSGGTPRVSLFCPPAHMIHVRRSFHGARVTSGTDRCDTGNCTYCPGTNRPTPDLQPGLEKSDIF